MDLWELISDELRFGREVSLSTSLSGLESRNKVLLVKSLTDEIEGYEVELNSLDINSIRQELGMTQIEFAAAFGLAVASVRNWEQKRSVPDASMRSYIAVIKNDPCAVIAALEKERRRRRVTAISI